MSLRNKTITFILLPLLGLLLALHAVSHALVLSAFAHQEQRHLHLNAQRIHAAIHDSLATLTGTALDWAHWDDTYRFIQDTNHHYYTSNLSSHSPYTSNRINFMLFINSSGHVVHAGAYDYRTGHKLHLPQGLISYLSDIKCTFAPGDHPPCSYSGIIAGWEGSEGASPALLAAEPILTSQGQGPVKGALFIGRYLDQTEIERLSDRTRLPLTAYRPHDPNIPHDVRSAIPHLLTPSAPLASAGAKRRASLPPQADQGQQGAEQPAEQAVPTFVQPLNDHLIAAYTSLTDIHGNIALLLRSELPRDIYQQGQATVRYFTALLLAIGLFFGGVTLLLVEKTVLSRLARLSSSLARVGANGNLSARVDLPGNDELSTLSLSINNMLDRLDQAQRAAYASERRYKVLVEQASDGIAILDARGNIIEANSRTCQMLGYTPAEVAGLTLRDLLSTDDLTGFTAPLNDLRSGQVVVSERTLKRKDGSRIPVEVSAKLLPLDLDWGHSHTTSHNSHNSHNGGVPSGRPSGPPQSRLRVQAIIRDITDRKTLQQRLSHQAFHDPLTGLPNRALLMDRLKHALERSGRHANSVAVLFLDLDNFKVINDSLGHTAGDQLLVELGDRLQKCLRAGDSVARLGGDEFTLLLDDLAHVSEATAVAERIADLLRQPFWLDGREVYATASIGIALSNSSQDRPDDLLKNADVVMYEAKKSGGACHKVFDLSMNSRAWERLQIELDLRQAIERGEFTLYYQPVVNLQTGKMVEVEALIRWEHPARGLMMPSDFMAIAEETRLILPIGKWVFEAACKQMKLWHDEHPAVPPATLSVNISAKQFRHESLVEEVAHALTESGLNPAYLKLEIAESATFADAEAAIATLHELKKLGVKLVIDDFGTGFSAFSYLKRYPMDGLKLDRSFISGLGRGAEDTSIVRAVIAFARILDLAVVAEGVETHDQLLHLQALGCDYAQGYYFAPPLPSSRVNQLFTGPLSGRLTQALVEESVA